MDDLVQFVRFTTPDAVKIRAASVQALIIDHHRHSDFHFISEFKVQYKRPAGPM